MKRLAAALIALFAAIAPAAAQQTQANVMAAIVAGLPVGCTDCISPLNMQSMLALMTQATFQSQGINGLSVSGTPQAGWQLIATGPYTAVWQVSPGSGRIKLTGGLQLYADYTNGNDTNACTAPGTLACKTVQQAYQVLVAGYDTAGQSVELNIAANDPNGLIINTSWLGGGQIRVTGPCGTLPPTTTLTGSDNSADTAIAIRVPLQAPLFVDCLELSGSAGAINYSSAGTSLILQRINYGAASGGPHIQTSTAGATIICATNYWISGSATYHYLANIGSTISCGGVAVTLSGTPAFAGAFAAADFGGFLYTQSTTYTGSATGPRYFGSFYGIILTGSSGNPNFFPGDSPGSVSLGALYP